MKSIIITSWKEPKTIGRAIEAFIPQMNEDDEMLVASPDYETWFAAKAYMDSDKRIKVIQDEGRGKPAALNMLFAQAKGDIFILSDGDVYVDKNAVSRLMKPLKDIIVGAVCGRTIALDNKRAMLGYWAHLLNDCANEERIERNEARTFLFCSGYLFAIRRDIATKIIIPEDVLDDAYISMAVWRKGFRIAYAKTALVYIKNPATLGDWICQKRRNAAGHKCLNKDAGGAAMKSFGNEVSSGFLKVMRYSLGIRELFYTFMLFPFRLWIWILAWMDGITGKTSKDLWLRVESSK